MTHRLRQMAAAYLLACVTSPLCHAQTVMSAEERATEARQAWSKANDDFQGYRILSEAFNDPALKSEQDSFVELFATQQSLVGRYRDAEMLGYSRASESGEKLPENMRTATASVAIVNAAKTHRVVMLNEAHTIARTRLLMLELLAPLREAGFTHLAIETLTSFDPVNERGYPTRHTGFYSREPVFGEIVRQALALGYVVVPYEYEGGKPGQQARETGQAENLAALLRDNPNARLLVHAGHGHITKDVGHSPEKARPMAQELIRLTGIQPLSIEQTKMWDHPDPAKRSPLYQHAVSTWIAQHDGKNPTAPFVVLNKIGGMWALNPAANDVSVFMAPWTDDQMWRELDGQRIRREIGIDHCTAYPCLIEARYAAESTDAVPADRQLLDAPGPVTLWLRDGCYRVTTLPNNTTAEGEVKPLCFPAKADTPSAE